MADPVSFGNADRDVQQALIALKKGAHLLKYDRKGKPKFYPFKLSSDESSLIWLSSRGERSLSLSSVSKIIPGQRTAAFQCYRCPEKDYLSFSLIYNNDKASLDLICKNKVEADIWFTGLQALISSGHDGRSKIDGWRDGGFLIDENIDLSSNSASDSSVSGVPDIRSSNDVGQTSKVSINGTYCQIPQNSPRTDVAIDLPSMQVKGLNSDVFRVSVSSAPSTSSHGSAQDDCDALGDIYVWGEIICENPTKVGGVQMELGTSSIRADVLLPKALESNIVLDVYHVACGMHHAALVTKQGEIFTWGEECGGRLGHGVGKDVIQPRHVESLASLNVDFVACGEFHTCAVTVAGELYTWGDGRYNAGLLGHGSDTSHWIPKRVSGSLDGLQVAQVSCGPWHTALITSSGQLFTFGDGTFGALGHGNRESVSYPREVESLMGLKTVAVACGVWHTAAVVEVIVTQSSSSFSSGKLFTWGDGDKNRLGHGDKEPRLKPTCVPSLIDHNFHKLACGHSLTVGLTTSGRIFTMGSAVYGQLGNSSSDGKLPCLVEDKLGSESVEHVACGSYHVVVLTSKNEVYTWGKGANGRLGHGDIEDRKIPTLVESLRDRHVKYISCGSAFTAAICLHKWVSGTEQSQCSSCRQAFGFTRKRHNCYNCGLVHCHSCSSRKAPRAAMAPNPGKAYRVCDSCYVKLLKLSETGGGHNKKTVPPRLSGENKDKLDKAEIRFSKSTILTNSDATKHLDTKTAKQGKKIDSSLLQTSQVPFLLQVKDISFSGGYDARKAGPKPSSISGGSSVISSRAVSPFSRRSSPPRSTTPMPSTSGSSISKSIAESLKKTNELLNQEVQKLRAQVDSLKQRCELQEFELQRAAKKTQEAMAMAAEESAKAKSAKEVIKSLTAQLMDMAEKLPPAVYDSSSIGLVNIPNGFEHPQSNCQTDIIGEDMDAKDASSGADHDLSSSLPLDGDHGVFRSESDAFGSTDTNAHFHNQRFVNYNGRDDHARAGQPNMSGWSSSPNKNASSTHGIDNGFKSKSPGSTINNQVDAEWIEQYEPGVYITLVALRDGTRDLKRVQFSRRRFGEHQAESWWSENRERVYQKFNIRGSDRVSSAASVQSSRRTDEASAVSYSISRQ